ncbi:hypothetical protein IJH01_00280 [Candidatus Saccharibacteria bacterium]|nr:hypothetical protein [Candidatus Saccharibacteria bacterium]
MTEQITRGYFEITRELFFVGKDEKGKTTKSALEQYAKVRHTQYELSLWRYHGVPLGQVNSGAKTYFSEKFLHGSSIREVDSKALDAAFEKLGHAVKDGCHGRCARLMEELNACLGSQGLKTVKVEEFLDFLTFNYRTRDDEYGYPLKEPGYSFEIRDFVDEYYREQFREELKHLEKSRRQMAMQDILKIIRFRMDNSKFLKK